MRPEQWFSRLYGRSHPQGGAMFAYSLGLGWNAWFQALAATSSSIAKRHRNASTSATHIPRGCRLTLARMKPPTPIMQEIRKHADLE